MLTTLSNRPGVTLAVMKRKVETRRTGEKSRKCITSTLQELLLGNPSFLTSNRHLTRGKHLPCSLLEAVFLAERVFPAFYFALHDSLRDTRPNEEPSTFHAQIHEINVNVSCYKYYRRNPLTSIRRPFQNGGKLAIPVFEWSLPSAVPANQVLEMDSPLHLIFGRTNSI